MNKVLITGITGFIGSKIAETLCLHGIPVIGLKRQNSNVWRCKDFEHQIEWVDIDIDGDWKQLIKVKNPNTIVHAAWIGVEANQRADYDKQVQNIYFLMELLSVCKQLTVEKFICMGSQAEYGYFNGKVSEEQASCATGAYGAFKLASLEILKVFSMEHNMNWIWLRVFSLFGEKENQNWLIPTVIDRAKNHQSMDLTAGEQRYAYLYIDDFAHIIYKLITKKVASGIYNVSSNEVQQLKTLIEKIRDKVNKNFILNFGAIPYREMQAMHMEGDICKIESQIGPIQFTNFNVALDKTVNYYKNS